MDEIMGREPGGYHKLTETLMGPYPELMILRRFGALDALSLLSLQAELSQLEWELKQISKSRDLLSFQALNWAGDDPEQRNLIVHIRKKMQEYNAALLQTANIASLSRPEKGNLHILRRWLDHSDEEGKNTFLPSLEYMAWQKDNERDLVTLNGTRNEDPLARWCRTHVLPLYHAFVTTALKKPVNIAGPGSGVAEYSDSRLAKLVMLLASIISSALPMMAIVILYYVQRTETRVWITMCLTVVFATMLATLTSAKSQEIFAATAAFAAVEVVFIGSVNGSGNCPSI